jgi:deoxyribonuclease-4
LEFTHFLLHPGTAKEVTEKSQGIDILASALNDVLKNESDIMIVLENTAHAKLAIGSDITDFRVILEKIDMPERIGFCIDTAHAHSYGYSIIDDQQQDAFITFLDDVIGISRIKLLHINDTNEQRGSLIDRHCMFGEGKIGERALARFAMHPLFKLIPFILELPEMALEKEKEVLDNIRYWK